MCLGMLSLISCAHYPEPGHADLKAKGYKDMARYSGEPAVIAPCMKDEVRKRSGLYVWEEIPLPNIVNVTDAGAEVIATDKDELFYIWSMTLSDGVADIYARNSRRIPKIVDALHACDVS